MKPIERNNKMLKPQTLLIASLIVVFSFAPSLAEDTYVDGYVKSDGHYVEPHFRSQADSQSDNFSARGNSNPYTGSMGSVVTPSLNPQRNESEYNYQPSTPSWNNDRPMGSSYKRPFGGM